MCGRFGVIDGPKVAKKFDLGQLGFEFGPRYNIAPGEQAIVITMNSPRTAHLMKWGLIPHWAKDSKIAYKTFNARAEEVELKPTFRESFKHKRCLVPASFYFEFARLEKDHKTKVPYLFEAKDQEVFAFAGLYSEWKDEKGQSVLTFSIITTRANKKAARVHSRMPVILHEEDWDNWADNSRFDLKYHKGLLKPYEVKQMDCWPVTNELNNARNDYPGLIEPVQEEPIEPSRPTWEEKI